MSSKENETIEDLRRLVNQNCNGKITINIDYDNCLSKTETSLLTENILSLFLHPLQAYRAIGTIDQCSKVMDIVKTMIERDMEPVEIEVLQAYIHFENEIVDKGFTIKSLLEAAERMKDGVHGKWHKEYNGMRKNINTGRMEKVYHCTCSVCGWETGNQGTRFKYCPMCGAKMDSDSKGE